MSLLLEDRALLDGFRQGRRDALQRVYDHYVDHVAAFLRGGFSFSSKGEGYTFKGCRAPSDLQDMLQETFCRAFAPEARLAYDGIHPYQSYLLTIARNLTIDRFRRQVREVYEPAGRGSDEGPGGGTPGGEAEPGGHTPEAQLLGREVAGLVRAFHESLSAEEREVLRVYFEDEEGQRQAAVKLGLTRHQLRKSIAVLRKRLQVRLVRAGYLTSTTSAEQRSAVLLLLAALTLR